MKLRTLNNRCRIKIENPDDVTTKKPNEEGIDNEGEENENENENEEDHDEEEEDFSFLGMYFYPKLCNQVRSLAHFVVQNSGDFLC